MQMPPKPRPSHVRYAVSSLSYSVSSPQPSRSARFRCSLSSICCIRKFECSRLRSRQHIGKVNLNPLDIMPVSRKLCNAQEASPHMFLRRQKHHAPYSSCPYCAKPNPGTEFCPGAVLASHDVVTPPPHPNRHPDQCRKPLGALQLRKQLNHYKDYPPTPPQRGLAPEEVALRRKHVLPWHASRQSCAKAFSYWTGCTPVGSRWVWALLGLLFPGAFFSPETTTQL